MKYKNYYNIYRTCESLQELLEMAERDMRLAMIWGNNKCRIESIKEAANRVCEKKKWKHEYK